MVEFLPESQKAPEETRCGQGTDTAAIETISRYPVGDRWPVSQTPDRGQASAATAEEAGIMGELFPNHPRSKSRK